MVGACICWLCKRTDTSRWGDGDDIANADGRLKDIVDLQMRFGEIREPFPINIFKDWGKIYNLKEHVKEENLSGEGSILLANSDISLQLLMRIARSSSTVYARLNLQEKVEFSSRKRFSAQMFEILKNLCCQTVHSLLPSPALQHSRC